MRQLVVISFVSVDGVMQSPGAPHEDPSNGFEHGGWLVPYFDAEMGQTQVDWIEQADGFLVGRKTFQIFESYWPKVSDPADRIARRLNTGKKFVVSNTLTKTDWQNSTIVSGKHVADEIRALKQQGDGELQVHGSPNLIQTLLEHDLVDEFRLWVFPVLIGYGKRLFGDGVEPGALKLVTSKAMSTGVLRQTYARDGKLRQGAVPPAE